MQKIVRGLLLAASIVVIAVPAGAQVLQTPGRPLRGLFSAGPPPDPNKPWQSVTFSAATLGGYDDNLTPQDAQASNAPTEMFTPTQSGYMGYVDSAVQYQRGYKRQHIDLGGRAFVNSFRNIGVTPSYGANAQGNLLTPVGRRTDLELHGDVRTDPFYALGTFSRLEGVVPEGQLPDVRPSNGFLARRSWGGAGAAALTSRVSRRNTLTAAYRYDGRQFEDQIGNNSLQAGSLRFGRGIGRQSAVDLGYQHTQSTYQEISGERPLRTDDVTLGYRHQYDRSATRHVSVIFGGGAQLVNTLGTSRETVQYTLPSAYADVRVDVARSWNVSANYRRSATSVDGLSAETFASDAAVVQLDGLVHRRVELTVSAAFSRGARAAGNELGEYTNLGTTTQLLYRIGNWSALAFNHSFYTYKLTNFSVLPTGLPAQLDRNTIRVGFTLLLPLYGTTPEAPQPGRRD